MGEGEKRIEGGERKGGRRGKWKGREEGRGFTLAISSCNTSSSCS